MYNVPNHSYVDSIHGRIILPDGRVLPMKRCPYPRLTPSNAAPATTAPAAKSTAASGGTLAGNGPGWVAGFEADILPHLDYLSVDMAAPYPPNNTVHGLYEYQWTGFYSQSAQSLLQPALGWGRIVSDNGNRSANPLSGDTEMAAYYYWGGNSVSGTFYSVQPLQTIHELIQGYNCGSGGGGCTWNLQIADVSDGQTSQITVGSSPAYSSVVGELEAGASSGSTATDVQPLENIGANCQSLFANHHLAWRNLTVKSETGTIQTPAYHLNVSDWTVFDDSAMNVTWNTNFSNDTTAADITWKSTCNF